MAVYRVASLGYAALLLASAGGYQRPVAGWLVLGLMTAWTAATTIAYSTARSRPLLVMDVLVTLGCMLASPYVQGPDAGPAGVMPVTATWIGGPALAWAVYGGRRAGGVAAVVLSLGDLWLRGLHGFDLSVPVNGAVLLIIAGQAREVVAAVGAALDNVRRHCGEDARAWVFAENDGVSMIITVRDEGPGIPEGRLSEAAAEGRLGIAQSIRGRIAGLGGTAGFTSVPGQGTEVELIIPVPARPAAHGQARTA
ncbi:DUF5931 domain-containing protein [Streptosporangium canum]|uniref:DUF5931 domain-containing protein n=1 Tax=Streptosporangium canum TaxID=324952 RepID=UPI0036AF713E